VNNIFFCIIYFAHRCGSRFNCVPFNRLECIRNDFLFRFLICCHTIIIISFKDILCFRMLSSPLCLLRILCNPTIVHTTQERPDGFQFCYFIRKQYESHRSLINGICPWKMSLTSSEPCRSGILWLRCNTTVTQVYLYVYI